MTGITGKEKFCCKCSNTIRNVQPIKGNMQHIQRINTWKYDKNNRNLCFNCWWENHVTSS